jgi:hypothetical protein
MTTGGGCSLRGTVSGSITATPFWVGNHIFPSRVFMPAGPKPPLHSALSIPSIVPSNRRDRIDLHGVFIQILLAHTIDAPVATHPEITVGIFEGLEDPIAK